MNWLWFFCCQNLSGPWHPEVKDLSTNVQELPASDLKIYDFIEVFEISINKEFLINQCFISPTNTYLTLSWFLFACLFVYFKGSSKRNSLTTHLSMVICTIWSTASCTRPLSTIFYVVKKMSVQRPCVCLDKTFWTVQYLLLAILEF